MSLKAQIERRLSEVEDFADPDGALEQYRTPANVAAHLLSLADLQDDIADRVVVDLGAGTGMLALGAGLLGPERVIGVEIDDSALDIARWNQMIVDPETPVEWVRADVRSDGICESGCTVLANPPFGAHQDNRHADREFLEVIASMAAVSYTIHNQGSQEFIEAFTMDNGGKITHAFRLEFPLPRQFMHHEAESQSIQAELYRIEWTGT